jgi:hypothetical protein
MKALLNGSTVTIRHDLTLELFIDELLSIPTATAIEFVDGPGGIPPTVEGSSGIRLYEVGRHWFRLTDADGTRSDLRLICVELPLLAFVERQCRSVGHGGQEIDRRRVRGIVRALSQTDWFNGRVADATDGSPAHTLAAFGC